jgi:predicted SprT family Zn-dependent metalloprotease
MVLFLYTKNYYAPQIGVYTNPFCFAGEDGMELSDAQQLARALMKQHGLRGWTYATNKRKKTLGLCFSRLKRIELSANFIVHNSAAIVKETLLHEIAHAIVGTDHGHDSVWKEMAEQIGASPARTTRNVIMPLGKWQATCGGCGLLFSRHRRPKYPMGSSCRHCGPRIGLLSYRHIEEILAQQAGAVSRAVPGKDLAVAAHTVASKATSKNK